MAIQHRSSGRLVAVSGASQSGKSTWVATQVAGAGRLLVWDYKGDWYLRHRCRQLASVDELAECVRSSAPNERLAFCPSGMNRELFGVFCRFAWVYLRQAVSTLVVEETASVTSSGKAPDAWGDVCRMGLTYGASIYAITQRPAESDKTALGNASLIHCHRMSTDADVRTMAALLRVPQARVDSLLPFQWIEREADGTLRSGGAGFAQKTVRPSHKKR
jgi:hypothetical protein